MTLRQDTIDCVTKAMDAFHEYWNEHATEAPKFEVDEYTGKAEFRNPNTAMEMLFNYVEERRPFLTRSDFRLLAVEQPFAVPLDPHDPTLIYVGRHDKTYEEASGIYIGEHKTTSFYAKSGGFRRDFLDSFSPNSQVDGYLYSGGIVYGKRFKGVRIDAALVHDAVHDAFKLIPIDRRFTQLDSWLWEARAEVAQIEANLDALKQKHNVEYLPAFSKNTGACTHYGGCPYMDLCKMWADPSREDLPPGFKDQRWSPFDELALSKAKAIAGFDGKIKASDRLYDNTRLSTSRQCKRRYYFRHVRNWETSKDRRALLFGGAWHRAMDVVWTQLAPNYTEEMRRPYLAKPRTERSRVVVTKEARREQSVSAGQAQIAVGSKVFGAGRIR